jgi:hypothetical protein
MSDHEVRAGECVTAIAAQHGFTDRDRVWDDPRNRALRDARADPNVLRPRDRLAIPVLEKKSVEGATDRRHRLVIDLPVKELRIVLRGHDGKALAGEAYELELARELRTGNADGAGMIKERVRITERGADLRVRGRVIALRFSELEPAGGEDDPELRGVQARLHNLGFDVGPIDNAYGHRLRAALAVFQAALGLEVNGEADGATRAKLEEEHGV